MDESSRGLSDFHKFVESLEANGEPVPFGDFENQLKNVGDEIGADDLLRSVRLMAEQEGLWGSEWHFSSSSKPCELSREQAEGWGQLWTACMATLEDYMPEAVGTLQEQQKLTLLQHDLRKRVSFNEGRPIEKSKCLLLGKAAILLNRIGLRGMANSIYVRSLYPKGTVGRDA